LIEVRKHSRPPVLRTVYAVLPHTTLQAVVTSLGLARQNLDFMQSEKPMLSEEGISPADMIAQCPAEADFVLLTQECSQSQLCYLPPCTPLSRADNIRSVHTAADTHVHMGVSYEVDSGLAVIRTIESAICVFCINQDLSYLPPCPPSLVTGLLTMLFRESLPPNLRNPFEFSVCILVSRRYHRIGFLVRASCVVHYYEGSDSWTLSPR